MKGEDGDVVGLDRVGNCRDLAKRCADRLRQVIDHPIGDVFDAVLAQKIEGLVSLGQTGAFPRARPRAAERFNLVERRAIAPSCSFNLCIGP